MIATDGAPTIANWPLSHGKDVQVTPPSPEGLVPRLGTDQAAPEFWECYTVIGFHDPVKADDGRYSRVYEARSADEAEAMAQAEDGPLRIAGVLKGETDVIQ